MKSEKEAGHANNDINATQITKVVVWKYLTDTNAWFVIDSNRAKRHALWMERTLPDWGSNYNRSTHNFEWDVYTRFTRGWDDYKWIYGQNPS